MGEKILLGHLDLTASMDEFNPNIWEVTLTWEAKGNGEEKRGITERVSNRQY